MSLSSQVDEDRLGHVLGQVRVTHLPQRRRVHQVDMALDQARKRSLRPPLDVLG